jgi:cephalosporin hydroxylase
VNTRTPIELPSVHASTLAQPTRLTRARLRVEREALRIFLRFGGPLVARLYHRYVVGHTSNFAYTRWLGVPVWQNVLDVWTIQETLAELRPALLIETGTAEGGSALMYAHLMDLMDHGRVITIDIDDVREYEHPRVTFLHGSSTDPEVVTRVAEEAGAADGPVMVILDGDHSRDHVARELELYAPLVTPGSYLLSQDGIIDQFGIFRDSRPGPLQANRDFLARNPEFEHDRERNERFGLTHHPLGWMRRRQG